LSRHNTVAAEMLDAPPHASRVEVDVCGHASIGREIADPLGTKAWRVQNRERAERAAMRPEIVLVRDDV